MWLEHLLEMTWHTYRLEEQMTIPNERTQTKMQQPLNRSAWADLLQGFPAYSLTIFEFVILKLAIYFNVYTIRSILNIIRGKPNYFLWPRFAHSDQYKNIRGDKG